MPAVLRVFDRVTAVLLVAGLLALAAGLGRHPPGLPLLGAGAVLGLAGLLHLVRHLRRSWRPVRTRAFTVHLVYVALFVLPCALTAPHPARSLLLAGAVLLGYFGFHAFREAFTAAESGLCSAPGFLLVLAGAVAALIAARMVAAPPDPVAGSWLASLAGDPSAPGRDFDRLFDLLLTGAFPLLATRVGVTDSRGVRWFWGACALLAASGVVIAFGRAAWLALLLELGLLLAFDRSSRRWLTAVLAATLLAAVLLPGGGDRVRSIVLPAHPTNSQRLEQWAAALELTLRSPLLGSGLGSFGGLYQGFEGSFSGRGYSIPHSLPLHIAAECGLPALVLFLTWMAWLFTGWRIGGEGGTGPERRLRALRLGAKVAAAGLLLFSCFDL